MICAASSSWRAFWRGVLYFLLPLDLSRWLTITRSQGEFLWYVNMIHLFKWGLVSREVCFSWVFTSCYWMLSQRLNCTSCQWMLSQRLNCIIDFTYTFKIFNFRIMSEDVSGAGPFPSTLHLSSATLKTLIGGDQQASEDAMRNQISKVVTEWLLKQHEKISVEEGDIVLGQRFPDQVRDSGDSKSCFVKCCEKKLINMQTHSTLW